MARALDDVSPRRSSFTTTLLVGGGLILAGVAIGKLIASSRARQSTATADRHREKALKDSFPASDPPASDYFDIPVNRQ